VDDWVCALYKSPSQERAVPDKTTWPDIFVSRMSELRFPCQDGLDKACLAEPVRGLAASACRAVGREDDSLQIVHRFHGFDEAVRADDESFVVIQFGYNL
jgi:hypothetical protein